MKVAATFKNLFCFIVQTYTRFFFCTGDEKSKLRKNNFISVRFCSALKKFKKSKILKIFPKTARHIRVFLPCERVKKSMYRKNNYVFVRTVFVRTFVRYVPTTNIIKLLINIKKYQLIK